MYDPTVISLKNEHNLPLVAFATDAQQDKEVLDLGARVVILDSEKIMHNLPGTHPAVGDGPTASLAPGSAPCDRAEAVPFQYCCGLRRVLIDIRRQWVWWHIELSPLSER